MNIMRNYISTMLTETKNILKLSFSLEFSGDTLGCSARFANAASVNSQTEVFVLVEGFLYCTQTQIVFFLTEQFIELSFLRDSIF